MGAQDLYYGRGFGRKSSDDEAAPSGENTDYYSNGLADALDYLRDWGQTAGDQQDISKEQSDAEARSRGDLARQWIDAIEGAGISKAGVAQIVEDLATRGHRIRARTSRSANIDAMRSYVLELIRTAGNLFIATRFRPF